MIDFTLAMTYFSLRHFTNTIVLDTPRVHFKQYHLNLHLPTYLLTALKHSTFTWCDYDLIACPLGNFSVGSFHVFTTARMC